ncbi:MAG: DUF5320 domain-containing protein [Coriobacteriia bacterium]|nr:DUF5320 domain-containing protein [Coriobacteriia bacterium]
MPGQDGTGPEGRGPLTGRGAGNCATPADETTNGRFFGRRLGLGRGLGLGARGRGRGLGRGLGWRR